MNKKNILVLDDDPVIVQIIKTGIEHKYSNQVNVITCQSSEEAARHILSIKFDLVISDFNLPGVSGMTFLAALQKHSPTTRTIMITAHRNPEIKSRSDEYADAFLYKPFKVDALIDIADTLLGTDEAEAVEIDVEPIIGALSQLRIQTGGSYVALLHTNGRPLLEEGKPLEEQENQNILLINSMNAAISMTHSSKNSKLLQYVEDDSHAVYCCPVNHQLFLATFIRVSDRQTRLGTVWLTLQQSVKELKEMETLLNQLIASGTKLEFGEIPMDELTDQMSVLFE